MSRTAPFIATWRHGAGGPAATQCVAVARSDANAPSRPRQLPPARRAHTLRSRARATHSLVPCTARSQAGPAGCSATPNAAAATASACALLSSTRSTTETHARTCSRQRRVMSTRVPYTASSPRGWCGARAPPRAVAASSTARARSLSTPPSRAMPARRSMTARRATQIRVPSTALSAPGA